MRRLEPCTSAQACWGILKKTPDKTVMMRWLMKNGVCYKIDSKWFKSMRNPTAGKPYVGLPWNLPGPLLNSPTFPDPAPNFPQPLPKTFQNLPEPCGTFLRTFQSLELPQTRACQSRTEPFICLRCLVGVIRVIIIIHIGWDPTD